MADKHDELALGMAKQLVLKAADVIVNRQVYYIVAVTDTVLTGITMNTDSAGTGETITGTLAGKTIVAGSQFPLSISAATVTSGECILYSRV
tara:strand:- start:853 stop:1128 length:276 start_codon:yes stop_codon:yes gene_type:complete